MKAKDGSKFNSILLLWEKASWQFLYRREALIRHLCLPSLQLIMLNFDTEILTAWFLTNFPLWFSFFHLSCAPFSLFCLSFFFSYKGTPTYCPGLSLLSLCRSPLSPSFSSLVAPTILCREVQWQLSLTNSVLSESFDVTLSSQLSCERRSSFCALDENAEAQAGSWVPLRSETTKQNTWENVVPFLYLQLTLLPHQCSCGPMILFAT